MRNTAKCARKEFGKVIEQEEVMKERLLNKELLRQAKELSEEEATPTVAEATPVSKPNEPRKSEEEDVEEDGRQDDRDYWKKVAEEAKATLSVREQARKLDQAEAEILQPNRRSLEALMRRSNSQCNKSKLQYSSTAQPLSRCINELSTYDKYTLDKHESTMDGLISRIEMMKRRKRRSKT